MEKPLSGRACFFWKNYPLIPPSSTPIYISLFKEDNNNDSLSFQILTLWNQAWVILKYRNGCILPLIPCFEDDDFDKQLLVGPK